MVRIIPSGCNGKMGRVITGCVANRADCRIVAGFDINTERHADSLFTRTRQTVRLKRT